VPPETENRSVSARGGASSPDQLGINAQASGQASSGSINVSTGTFGTINAGAPEDAGNLRLRPCGAHCPLADEVIERRGRNGRVRDETSLAPG
jgi:hypothetical protein